MSTPLWRRRDWLTSTAALGLLGCTHSPPAPQAAGPRWVEDPTWATQAPATPREFRAVWVATVANIDWPSRPGLSAEAQQAEIRALLDRCVASGLNAVVLQVRPCADALYPSALEPWSEFLSGTQGQDPGYDPLAVWLQEARARALELHAWINPYRAWHSQARSAPHPTHLSQRRPELVRRYGDQLWMDPAEPEAAAHTLAVAQDLLQRYELDGLHLDDYFYPYPVLDGATRQELDFPDHAPWQRYREGGGTLERADWRRQQVDTLVQQLYALVRRVRPSARLGLSPFGLPRPALRPPGIVGFSQYDKLYADVELWLREGWMDYLAPQLYWPRAQAAQAFEPLLQCWQGLNPLRRHIWPGLFSSKITPQADSWPVGEILGQIESTRRLQAHNSGHLHFSMVALAQNRRGLADALARSAYAQAALTPESPWLDEGRPSAAPLQLENRPGGLLWTRPLGPPPRALALWVHSSTQGWRLQRLAPQQAVLPQAQDDTLVLQAQDDTGRLSPPQAWRRSS
ncbi:glycoside hydrolase family 10 protein [Roseateles sp. BYS180W]|uniref:Glycoside hydrolase family 10 protein n=1 Tax=Roseateles rivi TaxID=3299028 RepID=A0ABW7FUJ9_9BURK